jgi:hypothetical protein
MTSTKYTYSIQNDFPNHKVDSNRLTQEVQSSAIVIALDHVDTADDDCDIWFKDSLSDGDKSILNGIVAVHSGEPFPEPVRNVSVTNPALTVLAMPPIGLKTNQISQNWCDKTTWWYSAVKVTGEDATTTDPDRKIWKVSHQYMIDVYHGKLTGEETITDYRVTITEDSIAKTEQDPHYGSGGDYIVNYAAGTITFFNSIPDGYIPAISYYYENGSTWVISPSPGEVWKLKGAESQFSEDVILNDTMLYEVWAYDPNNLPNKIQVVDPDRYKSIYDFINDANKAYPGVPPLGGTGWRGASKATYVMSWDFQTTTDLSSAAGMELHVRLEHDTPFGGTFATGTFYFIRNSES